MKCECGNNISTPEFMKCLDLSQLHRAVEIAQDYISQKGAEKKVTIYRVVEDGGLCYSNHLSFEAATVGFATAASVAIAKGEIPRELGIVRERHIESEVTDYCPEYVSSSTTDTPPQ